VSRYTGNMYYVVVFRVEARSSHGCMERTTMLSVAALGSARLGSIIMLLVSLLGSLIPVGRRKTMCETKEPPPPSSQPFPLLYREGVSLYIISTD
jgi:hypothetical protein